MQKAIMANKKLEEKDKIIEKKDKLLEKKDKKLCVQERRKDGGNCTDPPPCLGCAEQNETRHEDCLNSFYNGISCVFLL